MSTEQGSQESPSGRTLMLPAFVLPESRVHSKFATVWAVSYPAIALDPDKILLHFRFSRPASVPC